VDGGLEPPIDEHVHLSVQGPVQRLRSEELLKDGKRAVIQAITLRHLARERIRATPEVVYHSARSAFAVADDAVIDSIATCLWAIRDGYGTARPAEMASALVRAAVDHGTEARDLPNLRRIVICEPQRDDPKRYWLAIEAVLQARDLQLRIARLGGLSLGFLRATAETARSLSEQHKHLVRIYERPLENSKDQVLVVADYLRHTNARFCGLGRR
jgi:hypothetical protein